MIKEDRIELNTRFIEVFKLLEERGEIVLNDRGGKGIGDFAEKILGNRAYGHIVRAFLNPDDKRVIDYRHARTLCREYGINESYLIDGIGTPFGFDIPSASQPYPSSNMTKDNILFTSIQAFAGSTIDKGSFYQEDNEYFSLPGVQGSGFVAFHIEGDSMSPLILNGDMVICKEIRGLYEIKDNQIYAIKNNGSLWVKYVQRLFDKRGLVNRLKLISVNNLEYDPFIEEISEHTRLYKVTRLISQVDS